MQALLALQHGEMPAGPLHSPPGAAQQGGMVTLAPATGAEAPAALLHTQAVRQVPVLMVPSQPIAVTVQVQ